LSLKQSFLLEIISKRRQSPCGFFSIPFKQEDYELQDLERQEERVVAAAAVAAYDKMIIVIIIMHRWTKATSYTYGGSASGCKGDTVATTTTMMMMMMITSRFIPKMIIGTLRHPHGLLQCRLDPFIAGLMAVPAAVLKS
jgi:hypothetical protein